MVNRQRKINQNHYVVKSGDTLWKIAQKFETTVSILLAENPNIDNPNLIFSGQIIMLPSIEETCPYVPFPDQFGIDFSSIKYICSEKERDRELEKALIKEFDLKQVQNRVRYYYNKVDLNQDGTDEVFAYLVGPYVCGTGGCSAAIFKQVNGEYKLLSRFSLVNNPVIISNNKTNGYRDIIMYVSGGGIASFFAKVKYDGITYPSNPSIQPKIEPGTKIYGIAIVADDISKNPGIEL